MLKKARKAFRNKVRLALTPGEEICDRILKAGLESLYVAVNTTEKMLKLADKAETVIDGSTKLIGGGEAASSLGRIAFKTTKDIARADTVCTSLCLISGACEGVVLACLTIPFIPYIRTLYVDSKIICKGCMTYRNSCAGEGCD